MSGSDPSADLVLTELIAPEIMRITLNRPEARNAQDTRLLYALNAAFDAAARQDEVKVVILAANGADFSSGHDLRAEWPGPIDQYEPVGTWCGFSCQGAEGLMAMEKELFVGFCERWRTIPKVTIAQVQGRVIAGGLMLVWPCDLIVASEDAVFSDNTVAMGVCGAEYFAHPLELGVRKAKEMLFTADYVTAADAFRLGMVNRVVPRERLEEETLALARRIALKPRFALKLAKEAVNGYQDAAGRQTAMQTSFALHQLTHADNFARHGLPIDPTGIMSDAVRSGYRWEKPADLDLSSPAEAQSR